MENAENFEAAAVQLAKYIVDYFDNIRSRKVLPVFAPGFLRIMITDKAPAIAETWEDVFADIEQIIMPGICHWQHPRFASYFPSQTSYSAILAGMISNALAIDVISWKSCPSATELEVIVLDWVAKALKLPKIFWSNLEGDGGGVIQNSATECMLLSLFAARTISIKKVKSKAQEMEDGVAVTKLIAYKSEETHSSFVKACSIALVKFRNVPLDDKYSLNGNNLKTAIAEDRAKGLVPFYVCSTLGTTSLCAFDNIKEIGPVCKDEDIWLHVDAAYAGNAFICPEYCYLMNGVEYADSLCVSPHKWLPIPVCCSILWLRHSSKLTDSFPEPGEYLQCKGNSGMPNFTRWQLPCGRPFTSLKLWFILRLFGIRKLQKFTRKDIKLAQVFKNLIENDGRFELIGENILSLVCFRLKGSNELNEELIKLISLTREIHMGCSKLNDILFLRFVVNSFLSVPEDMQYSYKLISKLADQLLYKVPKPQKSTSKDCLRCMISILH